MKFLIALTLTLLSISASAAIGDKYTIFTKTGRASMTSGMVELIGSTVLWDHDNDTLTVNRGPYRAGISIMIDDNGDPISNEIMEFLGNARENRLTVSISYNPANVDATQNCLGLDFEYADPDNVGQKTCFRAYYKNLIIR